MPLTKRQKRRLFEVSKMIETSIVVKDDMEEIQLEYAQEIDKVVEQIQSIKTPLTTDAKPSPPVINRTRDNVKKARERRNRSKTTEETEDLPPIETVEEDPLPEWAKKLWKGIAKKCHPDRLSFLELSAIQIARRQIWFREAKKLLEQRSWPKLIHIGVQVDEYVDDISHRDQISWLSNEYNSLSKGIESIQTSLAWKWGTNWENVDLRINIITAVLNHKGIEVPSRLEITQMLLKLEAE